MSIDKVKSNNFNGNDFFKTNTKMSTTNLDSSVKTNANLGVGQVTETVNMYTENIRNIFGGEKSTVEKLLENIIKPPEAISGMVPKINDFGDTTDFQDVGTTKIMGIKTLISHIKELDPDYQLEGKTINELMAYLVLLRGGEALNSDINSMESLKKIIKPLESESDEHFNNLKWTIDTVEDLIELGYRDVKFVEIVSDPETCVDIIVLEDQMGNPHVHCPGTDATQPKDLMFDVFNFMFGDKLDDESILHFLQDKYCPHILRNQRNKAREIVEKYAKKAQEENKKIYLSGYSLGGALAGDSLYNIIYKHGFIDCFGGITFYNALQDCSLPNNHLTGKKLPEERLTEQAVPLMFVPKSPSECGYTDEGWEKAKEYGIKDYYDLLISLDSEGKLNLIANEGDIVHCANHPALRALTKYLDVDYNFDDARTKATENIRKFEEKYQNTTAWVMIRELLDDEIGPYDEAVNNSLVTAAVTVLLNGEEFKKVGAAYLTECLVPLVSELFIGEVHQESTILNNTTNAVKNFNEDGSIKYYYCNPPTVEELFNELVGGRTTSDSDLFINNYDRVMDVINNLSELYSIYESAKEKVEEGINNFENGWDNITSFFGLLE